MAAGVAPAIAAVRQDADDEDRNDNCEKESPMTVESRIFSVAGMFSRPKASLFVPLCLKPRLNYRGFGRVHPGREIAAHSSSRPRHVDCFVGNG